MWYGGGFIPIIIYGAQGSTSDSFGLLTENNINILTESGSNIDIEHT